VVVDDDRVARVDYRALSFDDDGEVILGGQGTLRDSYCGSPVLVIADSGEPLWWLTGFSADRIKSVHDIRNKKERVRFADVKERKPIWPNSITG
jgi:hypothetical protein